MKRRPYLRILIAILVLCAAVFGVCTAVAAPAGSAETKDGISVELLTEKEAYSAYEEVAVRLKITNSTAAAHRFTVSMSGFAYDATTVPTGSFDLSGGENADLKWVKDAASVNPDTGDSSFPIVLVIGAAVALAGLAYCILKGKGPKATIAMLLVICMVAPMVVSPLEARAAEPEKTITVSKTITIGDEECTITVTVAYECLHADANSDHSCDHCGAKVSDCVDSDSDHLCDLCGAKVSPCTDDNKDYICDVCGKEVLPSSCDFTTMSQENFNKLYTVVDDDEPKWALNGSGLVLTSQKGELFGGDNLQHNIFFQSGSGDWTAETKMTLSAPLSGNYQQAGMLIYDDADNYIKLVYGYGDGATKVQVVYEKNGVIEKDVSVNVVTQQLWLRIRKQGNTYTFYHVENPNDDYQQIGEVTVTLEKARLGFTAFNGRWSDAPEVDFAFAYLNITDADAPAWPARLYDVTMDKSELRLNPGKTAQLTAAVAARKAETGAAGSVSFTSSDPKVATVDANGLVTAVGEGYAVITANVENGYPATCAVSVMPENLYVHNSTGNPYLPIWEHIPDGEPYVFEDPDNPGKFRVYVYGSHDTKILLGYNHYCGFEQVVWSAPVEDLTKWTYHGIILQSTVQGTRDTLYAPDMVETVNDDGTKTYYFYPNNQTEGRRGMVTKSSRPDGPFLVCNWAQDSTTMTDGILGFDVAVIQDDDGRVYGYWGFENNEDCCWAELNPEDMATVKEGTQVQKLLPTRSEIESPDYDPTLYNIVQDENVDKWGFFEAPSIRKVGNKYVLLFSRRGLTSEPTGCNTFQLAYGYSDSPAGPWKWGGIIVDAGGEVITDTNGKTYRSFPADNTHGSICEISGQWYIFYHRSNNAYSRQSTLDAITVAWDEAAVTSGGAVRISMAETTSNGMYLNGMAPYRKYPASIASYLTNFFKTRANGPVIVPQYNKDAWDYIEIDKTNTIVGMKYFDFDQNAPEGQKTNLAVTLLPLGRDVTVDVYLRPTTAVTDSVLSTVGRDSDGNINSVGTGSYKVGSFQLTADMSQKLTTLNIPLDEVDQLDGKWGLFFVFNSSYTGTKDLCQFHSFELYTGELRPDTRDSFDFTAMTEEEMRKYWTIEKEDADNWTYVQGEGLKLTSQNDGTYGGGNNCENIFQLPMSGDGIVETKVILNKQLYASWQQFCLMVMDDQDNYVKMNYSIDGTTTRFQLCFEKNAAEAKSAQVNATAEDLTVWLRLQKVGNTYTGFFSLDGETFNQVGESFELALTNPKIGLAAFNDGGGDNPVEFTVQYVKFVNDRAPEEEPEPDLGFEPTDKVTFDDATSGDKFDFYHSSSGGFVVEDGKLVPAGEGGEFKAIYKDPNAKITSVSVNIYPGSGNMINGGLYINALNPGHAQDQIEALCVIVESNFAGWEDAPNRVDIIVGGFPRWVEHHRMISETGAGNNLFTDGEKEPLNLRVDIEGNKLTITVSLLRDPTIKVTTTYIYAGAEDLSVGDVGIRSQHSTASYDNFAVAYTTETENEKNYDFTTMPKDEALKDWSIEKEDAANWSYTEGEGLTITSQNDGIYGGGNNCENVFQLPVSGDFIAETKVVLNKQLYASWQQFCLLVMEDQDNYVKMNYSIDGTTTRFQLCFEDNGGEVKSAQVNATADDLTVWLRLQKVGNTYTGFFSLDGENFTQVGESYELVMDNPKLGLAAFNDGGGDNPVEFTVQYVKVTRKTDLIDSYETVNGSFGKVNSNSVISQQNNSLAVNKSEEFVYGILEADVTLNGAGGDNGIVFGLTAGNGPMYWEGNGASYYFFFIDGNGTARLGRTSTEEPWRNCTEKPIAGFVSNGTYHLTVIRDDVSIECYVNGVLYLSYADSNPLTGTKFGMRAGLSGITYKNVECESTDLPTYEEATDFNTLSGKLVMTAGSAIRAKVASLALHKTLTLKDGTLWVNMTPISDGINGIVFGADENANSYYIFGIEGWTAKLFKVVNGTRELIQQGAIYAGYSSSVSYSFEIIKNGSQISCYFHQANGNRVCYASFTDESPLEGTNVGVFTSGGGTVYSEFKVTDQKQAYKADTLLFGHSYMELWNNDCREDFPEYADSIDDIGIGGSIAAHWLTMIDQVVSYQPSLGIYMIGINDLTGYISPESIAIDVERALLAIKERLPEIKVVLVGVNHCPARQDGQFPGITGNISKTNELFREIAASYDWILYAETEYLFCTTNDATTVQNQYFSDTLHPNALGYDMLAEVIRSAIRGENQPDMDPDREESIVQEAKDRRISTLAMYNEYAYTAENWALAKPLYEATVNKINACTSKTEVNSLDLSAELTALAAIETKAAGIADRILSSNTTFQGLLWSKVDDKVLHMLHFNYALDNSAKYSETGIAFRMDNNSGVIGAGGVLLQASKNSGSGIDGYLLSYVTDANYIQVWYLKNAYNTNGSASTLEYIGGLVFGGSVVGTDFFAKIEGNNLYLTTLAEYKEYGLSKSLVVDLTAGGRFALYESGCVGALSWGDPSFDLTISYVAGKPVTENEGGTEEEAENKADGIADRLLSSNTTFQGLLWSKVDDKTLHMLHYNYALDESAKYSETGIAFRMDNNSGVIGTGGVILQAGKNANGGIDGYLLNYISDANYIQVWYMNNAYNSNGSASTLEYIGGLVFNGSVVGTDFFAKIEGNNLYLTTLAEYKEYGLSKSLVVDLTAGGRFALYASGCVGALSWGDPSFDLTISKVEGKAENEA